MPLVALSTLAILGIAVAVAVGLAFVGGIIWQTMRGREPKPDIPPGMRPGPADEVLERRMTERHVGWSMLFIVMIAVWLPFYWLTEPTRNVADEIEGIERSVSRGEGWYAEATDDNPTGFGCARCHGANAEGGTVAFTPPEGEPIPEYPVPPLNDVCGRLTIEEAGHIRDTIMQGRPGTPMPSWSIRFEGPMNDQQIQDLIRYIVSIQTIPDDQNLCLDPRLAEQEDPGGGGGPSPTPGPSPTVGAS